MLSRVTSDYGFISCARWAALACVLQNRKAVKALTWPGVGSGVSSGVRFQGGQGGGCLLQTKQANMFGSRLRASRISCALGKEQHIVGETFRAVCLKFQRLNFFFAALAVSKTNTRTLTLPYTQRKTHTHTHTVFHITDTHLPQARTLIINLCVFAKQLHRAHNRYWDYLLLLTDVL